jgi:hypothetical protein
MAKAASNGILLAKYIKRHAPEPLVRDQLDRGELRYEWKDPRGKFRASDDGCPQPPKGWWLETTINRETSEVRLDVWPRFDMSELWGGSWGDPPEPEPKLPSFETMFFVRVFPTVERPAREAPLRGAPTSAELVIEEADRRLQNTDKETLVRRGRKNFLEDLSTWLGDTHPKARQMMAKTIGDHLRKNVYIRTLLPEGWLRR